MRGRGTAQYMLCEGGEAASSGFLQLKLQPLGGTTDSDHMITKLSTLVVYVVNITFFS